MEVSTQVKSVDIIKRLKSAWEEHEFSFDIPVIDLQHIYLLYTFINLGIVCDKGDSNTVDQEFDRAFSNIIEFTSEHFFLEAEIFRFFDYPGKVEHLQQHKLFINKLKQRSRERKSGDPEAARRLVGDLMSWLFDHILKEDKQYVAFFQFNKHVIEDYTRSLVDENTIYITPFQLKLFHLVTGSDEILNILDENISQTVYHMWRTYDLSIQVPLIDIQHLWFLKLMVRLDRASRISNRVKKFEALQTGVKSVQDYINFHFTTEELFMDKFRFPDVFSHKREHLSFTTKLQKRIKEEEQGDIRGVLYLAQDLKEWLLSHIAVNDKTLLWHFRKNSGKVKSFARELIQSNQVILTKGQVNLYKQVQSFSKGEQISSKPMIEVQQ